MRNRLLLLGEKIELDDLHAMVVDTGSIRGAGDATNARSLPNEYDIPTSLPDIPLSALLTCTQRTQRDVAFSLAAGC